MIVQNLEVFEKIGQGEFATVYRGRHRDIPELVAIKAIPMQKLHINPPLKRMIEAEQSALQVLKHEAIVRLYHVLQTNKEVDLIYEYCEQGSLSKVMKHHFFSEPEVLKVLHDLSAALVVLKEHAVVHRDIKPENILVKNGQVKLADFGLCMVGAASAEDSFTHIGSFAFMAPESLSSFVYNSKTDVYSLGLLAFELLSGKLPFTTRDPTRLVEEKRGFVIDCRLLPHISADLLYMLERMTKFTPEERIGVEQVLFESGRMMRNLSIPK